jgi:hypothetical protein
VEDEPKKYFTPREVEALIPELTRVMSGLMDAHREAQQVRSVLQGEQRRVMMSGGAVLDRATWGAKSRRLEALTHQIQDGIAAIVNMGGVPKDLGLGLVDFPYLQNGEEVNLCWRFGETRIGFWHGLDEGYAGRKPV